MAKISREKLNTLPSVDELLRHPKIDDLLRSSPRGLVVEVVREQLERARQRAMKTEEKIPTADALATLTAQKVQETARSSLRRAINGLGVVLHTGLGRAPLPKAAQNALIEVSESYSNLEIDSETGRRGDRHKHLERLLRKLTGAEAALVVNNNAAATLLALNTLAEGGEAIVSRGQLIEIGGSFRLPEIMKRSGARMVEVGTTNRTHLSDYRNAISEETRLILKVHPSNYRITGFTSEVPLSQLVQLGREFNLPVIDDLGSGALVDLSRFGLPKEPVVRESIETGADLVTFSGDKLIGGPQAGVVVGRSSYVARLKGNQLTRTLRCGKLTYAAMEATLKLFLDEERLKVDHPVILILTKPLKEIEKEAKKVIRDLSKSVGNICELELTDGLSEVGGGSLATESLPTKLVAIKPKVLPVDELAGRLRLHDPPIYARIEADKLLLDFRTVRRDELQVLVQGVVEKLQPAGHQP